MIHTLENLDELQYLKFLGSRNNFTLLFFNRSGELFAFLFSACFPLLNKKTTKISSFRGLKDESILARTPRLFVLLS